MIFSTSSFIWVKNIFSKKKIKIAGLISKFEYKNKYHEIHLLNLFTIELRWSQKSLLYPFLKFRFDSYLPNSNFHLQQLITTHEISRLEAEERETSLQRQSTILSHFERIQSTNNYCRKHESKNNRNGKKQLRRRDNLFDY